MKVLKKYLISMLTIIMVFQIFGTTGLYVYATEIDSADSTTEDTMVNDTTEENEIINDTYEEDTTDSDIENDPSNVVLSEYGITIKGTYYTEDEFEKLLETAVEVEDAESVTNTPPYANNGGQMSRMAVSDVIQYSPLLAGTWAIPGVGQVVITTVGVIVIAGVTIKATHWAYKKVRIFFTERAYNKAKKDWTTTKTHSTTTKSKVPISGERPYSSKDKLVKGKRTQRRYYDKNGNADFDVDYSHSGKYKFPHTHTWKGKDRSGH